MPNYICSDCDFKYTESTKPKSGICTNKNCSGMGYGIIIEDRLYTEYSKSPKHYICSDCDFKYTESTKPKSGICTNKNCSGMGYGIIIEDRLYTEYSKSPKHYICSDCDFKYTESTKPKSGICTNKNCYGMGYGIIIEDHLQIGYTESPLSLPDFIEASLAVFLMDASSSMADPMFPNLDIPSQMGETDSNGKSCLSKREAMSQAVATGVFSLQQMNLKESTYILAIVFDVGQTIMFVKTVDQIIKEYKDASTFAKFIFGNLVKMGGSSDVNSALKIGYIFVNKFSSAKSIIGMPSYFPFIHSVKGANKTYDTPNIRVLLYTDGEHLNGTLKSPFKEYPNPLINIFIGQKGDAGHDDLLRISDKCPVHDHEQFFLMNSSHKMETLRGLFRGASGASGFCPYCVMTQSVER